MELAEQNALWEEYSRTRNEKLKEKLIIEYSQLVKYIAGRLNMYLGNNVDFDDLVGYGVFGLIDAIDKFDYSKGNKFETYASLRIRGEILDNIRRMDWVPRSLRKKKRLLDAAMQKLEVDEASENYDEIIAQELNISLEEYYRWENQTKALHLTSLDEHIEQNGEFSVQSLEYKKFDQPFDRMSREETKTQLIEALGALTDKEKKVISLYYYDELTLKEISLVLGVSESRVSQLHTKSLRKMRRFLGDDVELLAYI